MGSDELETLPRSHVRNARADERGEAPQYYIRAVFSEAGPVGSLPGLAELIPFGPSMPNRGPERAVVLGRRPAAELRGVAIAGDGSMSCQHTRVELRTLGGSPALMVEDLGSRNGTWVDGRRVQGGPVPLRAGSVLRLGGTVFVAGSAPLKTRARLLADHPLPAGVIAESWAVLSLWERIVRLALSNAGVLFLGEMGTGKTRFARLLHEASPRRVQPFLAHNCAAIPLNLEEATLFGVVGGFIPGVKERSGLLVTAGRGTLFLDELADMPRVAQAKLLDAFDPTDPSFLPVGGNRRLPTRCRLVSATNRDVFQLAREGVVRQDLLSRLVVAQLTVPPLRERREDLLALFGAAGGTVSSAEVAEELLLARWVENVRGLETLATRVTLGEPLDSELIRGHANRGGGPSDAPAPREDVTERGLIWPPEPDELLELLARHQWSIKDSAAAIGTRRETVSRLVKATFGSKQAAQAAWRERRDR